MSLPGGVEQCHGKSASNLLKVAGDGLRSVTCFPMWDCPKVVVSPNIRRNIQPYSSDIFKLSILTCCLGCSPGEPARFKAVDHGWTGVWAPQHIVGRARLIVAKKEGQDPGAQRTSQVLRMQRITDAHTHTHLYRHMHNAHTPIQSNTSMQV